MQNQRKTTLDKDPITRVRVPKTPPELTPLPYPNPAFSIPTYKSEYQSAIVIKAIQKFIFQKLASVYIIQIFFTP
jgi:hypothetical protein